MAHHNTRADLPFGAITVHHIVSAARAAIEAIEHRNRVRQTLSALERLSPEQLDDIGLSAGDLDYARRTGRI